MYIYCLKNQKMNKILELKQLLLYIHSCITIKKKASPSTQNKKSKSYFVQWEEELQLRWDDGATFCSLSNLVSVNVPCRKILQHFLQFSIGGEWPEHLASLH